MRPLLRHPQAELAAVTSRQFVGKTLAEIFPRTAAQPAGLPPTVLGFMTTDAAVDCDFLKDALEKQSPKVSTGSQWTET